MVENEAPEGKRRKEKEGRRGQNFSTARCRLVRNQRSVWRQVCVTDGGPKSGIYSKRQLMLQLFLPSSFAATWAGLIVNRVAIDNVISIIRFRALRFLRPRIPPPLIRMKRWCIFGITSIINPLRPGDALTLTSINPVIREGEFGEGKFTSLFNADENLIIRLD